MTAFDQPIAFHAADAVLARWGHDPHALVQVLRETQAQTHWLPRDLLAHIAQALRLPLAQVEGVATFYRFFHTRPVGGARPVPVDVRVIAATHRQLEQRVRCLLYTSDAADE